MGSGGGPATGGGDQWGQPAQYLYGRELSGVQQGGQGYSPLADAPGSLRQWTDAAGAGVGSASYDPFGGVLSRPGFTSSWGFAGEYHDPLTGLQYLRARWYQPGVGRFTQGDPFPGVLALPLTQHPYVYGLNSPTNLTDPTGRFIHAILAGALFGAGTAASANWLVQVIENHNKHCLSWLEAVNYKNIDWGAVGGAAIAGGVAGGLFAAVSWAVPAFLKTLGASGLVLRVGTIVLKAYLGAGTNLVGDFTGRIYQSYYFHSPGVNIFDKKAYALDILVGGVLAALSGAYTELTDMRISSDNAVARSGYIQGKQQEVASWGRVVTAGNYDPNLVWNRIEKITNIDLSSETIKTIQAPTVPLLVASTQAVELIMNVDIANAFYKILTDSY